MRVYYADPHFEPDLEAEKLGARFACSPEPAETIAVLVVHQQQVDAAYLDCFPALKGVIRLGVGYDKVDLGACQSRGIQVANIPDYCTTEVADSTLAMILSLTRGLMALGARLQQAPGNWQNLTLSGLRRLSHLTLGVVGAGRIGSAVLERARAFGFQRIYYDPWVKACPGTEAVAHLETLLQRADIVSLHVPLNAETRGLVNRRFIQTMKPGSVLINTARGKLLGDEVALLDALKSGHLAGAALDVLPVEPPEQEPLITAWLNQAPVIQERLLLTPHNAFYSRDAELNLRQNALAEAQRCLAGEDFLNQISLS